MGLEDEVAKLVYEDVELTPQMVELGMKYLDDPDAPGETVAMDAGEVVTFLLGKIRALSQAVVLLAAELDRRGH
jgi:hypothetical protein